MKLDMARIKRLRVCHEMNIKHYKSLDLIRLYEIGELGSHSNMWLNLV